LICGVFNWPGICHLIRDEVGRETTENIDRYTYSRPAISTSFLLIRLASDACACVMDCAVSHALSCTLTSSLQTHAVILPSAASEAAQRLSSIGFPPDFRTSATWTSESQHLRTQSQQLTVVASTNTLQGSCVKIVGLSSCGSCRETGGVLWHRESYSRA